MEGPIRLVRSDRIAEYKNLEPIYEWLKEKAYCAIDRVVYKGKTGAVLCYCNPPVHQVGNPGLDAYLEGLDKVFEERSGLEYLIIYGSNDPVHAGGDLKESLTRLDATIEKKRELRASGAPPEEIDRLFDWADNRIKKGVALHGIVRKIAGHLRVVALCGGGTRFGGSAEIPLMADYLVGDSRSAMCFSEAMIGIIPGWSGVARTVVKAGPVNAEYMAKTSKAVKAEKLKRIGVYNMVVDVPFEFPRRQKSGDPEADKADYLEALQKHNDDTGLLLVPKGLELATCPEEEIPRTDEKERVILASEEEISSEVEKRKDPRTYEHIAGKSLKEVKEDIKSIGRPLAPQSIEALDELLGDYDPSAFDEKAFVQKEGEADSRLYRDAKFRAGLIATLEQRVADFREAS